MAEGNVVRKAKPLTKCAAKAKIASGLQRAVAAHGKDKIAEFAGCDRRTIENALAHTSLLEAHTLLNILDLDEMVLDEILHCKGFQLIPHDMALSPDMQTLLQMSEAVTEFIEILKDRRRTHQETLRLAELFRPLIPRMSTIVSEAEAIKSGTTLRIVA